MPAQSTILICFDGSEASRQAIERAGALHPGRPTLVLTVWERAATQAGMGSRMAAYTEAAAIIDEGAAQWAQDTAREGAALATQAGLDVQRSLTAAAPTDEAWSTIVEVSDDEDVALIVIGSRGLSRVKSWFLGSVSHAVAQHTTRPVLIVK